MLMRSYNKLFTINCVYLSILENTMSSLLSMAFATLIQPYKKTALHCSLLCTELLNLVSTSNYNLPVFFSGLGLIQIEYAMSNRMLQVERFLLWNTLELLSWRTASAPGMISQISLTEKLRRLQTQNLEAKKIISFVIRKPQLF